MIYETPSKSNLAFPTDMKIGLITFSQKLLLNSCFQQLENTKSTLTFHKQKTRNTNTHTPTRIIEVTSPHPLVLTHNSATGTANLCHSSVGSVVTTPLRGNWNNLSCSVQAADGGVSNVRSANELLSVSTNTSDESVPRSATVPSPHCGKEGGQSRIINLVAEGVPVELDRDWSKSLESYSIKALKKAGK